MAITLGHNKDLLGLGDLALIFMVFSKQIRSNLRVCGGETFCFLRNNTNLVDCLG